MDTLKQATNRTAAIGKIIGAMMNGRRLSLFDSSEFRVSEMHTCFCVIRQKIRDGKITVYVMKDKWLITPDGIRYKEYWFEDENNEN